MRVLFACLDFPPPAAIFHKIPQQKVTCFPPLFLMETCKGLITATEQYPWKKYQRQLLLHFHAVLVYFHDKELHVHGAYSIPHKIIKFHIPSGFRDSEQRLRLIISTCITFIYLLQSLNLVIKLFHMLEMCLFCQSICFHITLLGNPRHLGFISVLNFDVFLTR